MHSKHHILNIVAFIILTLASCIAGSAVAQTPWNPSMWGTSDTSIKYDYGQYQWPISPCPEVQIKQKHDHTPLRQYRAKGWDTVVTCATPQIELSCIPYIPTQRFNGQYTVDPIPFDPPDPTFSQGIKMPVSTDDDFADSPTPIPFDFYFFGLKKTAFVLGANGLITFDSSAAGRYCPWRFSTPLPWNDAADGIPYGLGCTKNNMRDAIYGIYEDTHPIASYLHGDQGIYYGIQGEEPCRKIIASWNGIPTFPGSRNGNNRCTYQIVCYEGSNIIEVHIKRRGVNPDWQNGHGLLGIQNATGNPQTTGLTGTTNMFVRSGAPPAYFPLGYNLLTQQLDSVAFRFTPQDNSTTQRNAEWYRILDTYDTVNQRYDTVHLRNIQLDPSAVDDTNGYYYPLGHIASRPFLTRARVKPSVPSRYVFHLRFMDAAGHWYYLYDTIHVGVDRSKDVTLRPSDGTPAQHQMDICSGQEAHITMEFPELQDTLETHITLTRLNGSVTPLDNSLLTLGTTYIDEQTSRKRLPLLLTPDAVAANLPPGTIDSIQLQVHVTFVSGCDTTISFLVRTFPNYDTTEYHGICYGDTFHWDLDGRNYTSATTAPMVNLYTVGTHCDSIVHLNLSVSDISYAIDHIEACKPIQWHGRWFYQSNSATAATDTVHSTNRWGCDSVTQLDFILTPMTPLIDASLDYFDFNNLTVQLTDVSIGGNSRTWYFPTGDPQSGRETFYTAPYDIDSALIMMVEYSPYGCIDTATVTIPFRRDVIWAPNTFTPDIPDGGNDHFHTLSTHLIKQQTLIYNRFGQLIFHCEEIDCPWDGTYQNGDPCPQGTYIYVIRYITEYAPRETQTLRGTVTLLR